MKPVMKNICPLLLVISLLILSTRAWALEPLTDEQLNAVTAGSQETALQNADALMRIPFSYSSGKGNVDGEVIVVPMTSMNQQSTLQLMDNAQANLRSLININAVNSPVQVLLNLNININSQVGTLNQWNQLLSAIQ